MASGLDVWVAQPGGACRVDSGSWKVTVRDAHYQVFQWAGQSYANLSAPHAHWAANIPPGTYIVHAVEAKGGRATDHAIATVGCGEVKCVHLFVPGHDGHRPSGGRPDECVVEVTGVWGRDVQEDTPGGIEVSGTATGCDQVLVEVRVAQTGKSTVEVVGVTAGDWTAGVSNRELDARCGDALVVEVTCTEHRDCRATHEVDRLPCD